jgi:hypothetical protein
VTTITSVRNPLPRSPRRQSGYPQRMCTTCHWRRVSRGVV